MGDIHILGGEEAGNPEEGTQTTYRAPFTGAKKKLSDDKSSFDSEVKGGKKGEEPGITGELKSKAGRQLQSQSYPRK